MKIYFVLLLIISLFMLIFPLAVNGKIITNSGETAADTGQTAVSSADIPVTAETDIPKKTGENTIKVLRTSSGKVIDLALFDYVVGSVAGEMPAYFEKEALKAQAVACYTFAKKLCSSGGFSGADITDSPEKHQNYLDEKQLKEKWGGQYDANIAKIKQCVSEVFGEYMTYGGEIITACYHSLSAGKTEDALTVWGKDIPYLKSVSAEGDRLSPDFDRTVTVTEKQFRQLAEKIDGVKLPKDAEKWIKVTEKSDSGFVKKVKLGSKEVGGNDIRSAFSLASAWFTVKHSDGKFIFSVRGKGHGLGMSQYSADFMARQGKTYREILEHFYQGISIVKE